MNIPVSFEWKGKKHVGYFSEPHGSGGNIWFLTVNKYHWGQLILKHHNEWAFYNSKDEMKELADYFGDCIVAWYQ
jgi:hypothetical protein